jgi:acylphosphatase
MTLYARVKGRVQGVGFRYFVQRHARDLGLDGSVRNLGDGGVELEATGSPEDLDRLEALIRQGPPGAHVEHVAAHRGEGEADGSGFSVRFL